MGGHRGFQPQIRGYAIQDVEWMKDIHLKTGPSGFHCPRGPWTIIPLPLVPKVVLLGDVRQRTAVDVCCSMGTTYLLRDPGRFPAGPNGYGLRRVDLICKRRSLAEILFERPMAMPTYDQLNSRDRNMYLHYEDLWSGERPLDRSMAPAAATSWGTSTVPLAQVAPRNLYPKSVERDVHLCNQRILQRRKIRRKSLYALKN
ncbi:hypothetical protein IFM89_014486 [Coptis chinensis]|uniref:Uncharacterized protein n=1 Tax=Coptis chinensis TaxID=261450 RepID=A0A835HEK3_9MAGN|nr:hypothetical protein IFM89_014486 [Coptis chinensis]